MGNPLTSLTKGAKSFFTQACFILGAHSLVKHVHRIHISFLKDNKAVDWYYLITHSSI